MHPACLPRARPPNRNAATPSTRLLPRYRQLEFFELKPLANALNPKPPPRSDPGPSVPRVLVLARPSAREDGTIKNRNGRISPRFFLGNPGNPKKRPRKRPGKRPSTHPDRAATAVSNNRVNEV